MIKTGPNAFLMGYRISFKVEVIRSISIRDDIVALSRNFISHYQKHELQQSGSSDVIQLERNSSRVAAAPELHAKTGENNSTASTGMETPLKCELPESINNKRGRPELSKEEMRVRLNRIRVNINYNKKSKMNQQQPSTTKVKYRQ